MDDGEGETVAEAMITCARVHAPGTTVAEAHGYFADGHVHALLVVGSGTLHAVVERGDLLDAPLEEPARTVGRLDGRVVGPGAALGPVRDDMVATGQRRRAVVDEQGTLLGLLCLKRSGRGFCSDEGVAARAAERALTRGAGPRPRSG